IELSRSDKDSCRSVKRIYQDCTGRGRSGVLAFRSGKGDAAMTRLFAGCRWGLRHGRPRVWPAAVLCVALVSGGIAARADDSQPVTQADLQKLMQDLDLQKKKLAAQEQALAEQQRVIANQQNQLNFLKGQVGLP